MFYILRIYDIYYFPEKKYGSEQVYSSVPCAVSFK
jgi:hypothetical protein